MRPQRSTAVAVSADWVVQQRLSPARGNIVTYVTSLNMTAVLKQAHNQPRAPVRTFERPKTCLTLGK
jgi:hypothetical protein